MSFSACVGAVAAESGCCAEFFPEGGSCGITVTISGNDIAAAGRAACGIAKHISDLSASDGSGLGRPEPVLTVAEDCLHLKAELSLSAKDPYTLFALIICSALSQPDAHTNP